MKRLFVCTGLMVVLSLVLPTWVEAQQNSSGTQKQVLPKFQNGITYREARKKIIELGWQPITLPTAIPCGDDDRCRGFPEVYFCSGVGRAVCIYMWKKKATLIEVFGYREGEQAYDSLRPCKSLHPTEIDGVTCR